MKNLIAALGQQLTELKELHGVLKRETNELSDVHIGAMAEINAQKEEISSRMYAHAAVLRAAIQEVAHREGLSSNTTLGEIASRCSQKGNPQVAGLHTELNGLADQVKELLALNRAIAEKFALSVGSSLDFISRIVNQTSTYGASGGYQQRSAGAVLINREA